MVIGSGGATAIEGKGSAPADSNAFVARATTAIAADWTATNLILRTILDITPTPIPLWLMVEG
jgi:hypothetical protein